MRLDSVNAVGVALAASMIALSGCDVATAPRPPENQESVVVRWNKAALEAVRHTHLGPPRRQPEALQEPMLPSTSSLCR